MYKLKFTLKQHTPLIHFQHDQYGATLRATEVKPKLDRFIIELCKRQGIDYKKWLIGDGEEYSALDYKIRFIPSNQSIEFLKSLEHKDKPSNPIFFGNMGEAPVKHYSIADRIKVVIFSFNHDLIAFFDEEKVCSFFLLNNFSTRHSKGIGCFYPIEYNRKVVTTQPDKLVPLNTVRIEIGSGKKEDVFATIDYFWKWLKSGINYSQAKIYKDSILKLYISDTTSYKWEKRKIKELFLGLPADYDSKFFARAFLGLPDNFSYKWIPSTKRRKGEIYSLTDLTINIKCKNEEIQRNPSPFFFVPFTQNLKTTIYILLNSTHLQRMVNSKFELAAQVNPLSLPIGFDSSKGKDITRKINQNMKKIDAEKILDKAKKYSDEITNEKKKKRQILLIEKTQDFIDFFDSAACNLIIGKKTIITPNSIPDLNQLLDFAITKTGNTFVVKDFYGKEIVKAKIFKP